MSWQRCGWPLFFFKGTSQYYVWSDGQRVEDYGTSYPDNPSFCELIHHFVLRETGDKEYAEKILFVLAKKLDCAGQLRKNVKKRFDGR